MKMQAGITFAGVNISLGGIIASIKRTLSNYEAGRRLEYRIRDIFRRQGFIVIRAAQSKPIDLVCIRNGTILLIECKAGRSYMGPNRKRELLGLSEQAGAPIVLAKRRKRDVEFTNLSDGRTWDPADLDGFPNP